MEAEQNKITPRNVVEFFLRLQQADDDSGDVITNLKAQKLLYYAQGVSLAKTGKPLFDDDFYAWQHGPVIPTLYQQLKQFGSSQIEPNNTTDIDIFTDKQKEILKQVYYTFGQYSAWKLRDMTHAETPWKSVELSEKISKESIKSFFEKAYSA